MTSPLYRTPRTDEERDLCRLIGDRPVLANVSIRPMTDIRPTCEPPRLVMLGPGVRFDMGEPGKGPLSGPRLSGPRLFGPGDLKRFFVAVAILSFGIFVLLGAALVNAGRAGDGAGPSAANAVSIIGSRRHGRSMRGHVSLACDQLGGHGMALVRGDRVHYRIDETTRQPRIGGGVHRQFDWRARTRWRVEVCKRDRQGFGGVGRCFPEIASGCGAIGKIGEGNEPAVGTVAAEEADVSLHGQCLPSSFRGRAAPPRPCPTGHQNSTAHGNFANLGIVFRSVKTAVDGGDGGG
jgi:hypothetical protein